MVMKWIYIIMTSKNSYFFKRDVREIKRKNLQLCRGKEGKSEMNIIIIKMFIITDCYYSKLL